MPNIEPQDHDSRWLLMVLTRIIVLALVILVATLASCQQSIVSGG